MKPMKFDLPVTHVTSTGDGKGAFRAEIESVEIWVGGIPLGDLPRLTDVISVEISPDWS